MNYLINYFIICLSRILSYEVGGKALGSLWTDNCNGENCQIDRRLKTEDRRQKTEDRRQKIEDRRQKIAMSTQCRRKFDQNLMKLRPFGVITRPKFRSRCDLSHCTLRIGLSQLIHSKTYQIPNIVEIFEQNVKFSDEVLIKTQ